MALKNNKSLGQHWLKDRAILDEIAESARLTFDDPEKEQPLCVEIGPGLGTLTSSLLRNFPKVLAIEFDERLATNLPKSFPGKNLEVRNLDILKFDFQSQIDEPFVVAGNIPYYITSPIITQLIYLDRPPEKITLLIQKEVADRILAEKGDHSVMSLVVQNRAVVTAGIDVPREYFTPPPKVDSKVIILEPRSQELVSEDVIKLARIGFESPRKKLMNNLVGSEFEELHLSRERVENAFDATKLNPNSRPADLDHEDWKNLLRSLMTK